MAAFAFLVVTVAFSMMFHHSYAISEESQGILMTGMMPKVNECVAEMGVDFKTTKEKFKAGSLDADSPDRCIFACVFKKKGIIDEEGKYNKEKALEIVKDFTNAEDIEKFTKTAELCDSVNDEAVSDGKDGCNRAVLLMKCISKAEDIAEE